MQVTPESILHDGHLDRYDFSYTMGGYDTVNIQAYIALQWGSPYGSSTLDEEWRAFIELSDQSYSQKESRILTHITSPEIVWHMKERYVESGYYVKERNIFQIPFWGSEIILGVSLESLLYSTRERYILSRRWYLPREPLREAGIQKKLRAALALGVVSRVLVREPFEVRDIWEYLISSGIPLVRFAQALRPPHEDSLPRGRFSVRGNLPMIEEPLVRGVMLE